MSGRSVTITIGSTGSIRATPVPRASGAATLAGEKSKDKMYEPKHSQKMVRVLTVIAYMFAVSLAAIVLSVYYVFVWKPPYDHKLKMPVVSASLSSSLLPTLITNVTDDDATTISTLTATPGTTLCSCPSLSTVPSDGERYGSLEDIEGNRASAELSTDRFGSQPDIDYDRIVVRGPD